MKIRVDNLLRTSGGFVALCGIVAAFSAGCVTQEPFKEDNPEAVKVLGEALSKFSEKAFLSPKPDNSSGDAWVFDDETKSVTYNVMLCVNDKHAEWEKLYSGELSKVCAHSEPRPGAAISKNKITIGSVEYTFNNPETIREARGKIPDRFFIRLALKDKQGYVISDQIVPIASFSGDALPKFKAGEPSKYSAVFKNLTQKQYKAAREARDVECTIGTDRALAARSGLDMMKYNGPNAYTIIGDDNSFKINMVNLSPYFCIGEVEVTRGLWKSITGKYPETLGCREDNRPVENVTLQQCEEMIAKLNSLPKVKRAQLHFRLPTSHEWKIACLAGGHGKFGNIKNINSREPDFEGDLLQMGWFRGNIEGKPEPQPVGQKIPNSLGIYDMHGNVREWVSDGNAIGSHYVCGGSYASEKEEDCSTEHNDCMVSSRHDGQTGFRLFAEIQ